MSLEVDYSLDEINRASKEILQYNQLKNAYLRPLLWRESQSLGVYSDNLKTNLLVIAQESNPPFKNNHKLMVSPWRKIAENAIPTQSKSSAHYAMAIIGKKIAQDQGYHDALVLDRLDNIAECSIANIFFGNDSELVTPIADRFLNGITRQTIIKLGKDLGMKVKETRLSLDEIKHYDCCFATGTAAEVTGVSEINTGKQTLHFSNNQLVNKIQNAYAQLVGKVL